jgi:hypothetical protein
MSSEQRPYAAFILTLAGGALIFSNGLVFVLAARGISRVLEYVMNASGLSVGVVLAVQQMLLSLSVVGLILGVIGGSFAIAWRPKGA